MACSIISMMAIGSLSYVQYQNAIFEKQRRDSLKAQAGYLSEQSLEKISVGNREDAIRDAIKISTDEGGYASPNQILAITQG